MKRVLFVCQCNVCRSPMAEFLFKHMMAEEEDLEIRSAGVSGERAGCDMSQGAKDCLSAHGIPFAKREAVVFSLKDYLESDWILCMDEWSSFQVKVRCLEDPERKVRKLLEFSRSIAGLALEEAMLYTNVTDPTYTGDYERTFAELLEGCMGLKAALQKESEKGLL